MINETQSFELVQLLKGISEYLDMEKQIKEITEEEENLLSEKRLWQAQAKAKRHKLEELLKGNDSDLEKEFGGVFEISTPEDIRNLPIPNDLKNFLGNLQVDDKE